ncbi:unnamed protein product, partial [marine sediment metagenome]
MPAILLAECYFQQKEYKLAQVEYERVVIRFGD